MLATYHNHTGYSDGKGAVDDLIASARKLGVGELGISDHYTLFPTGRVIEWSMKLDRLDEYVAEITAAKEATEDVAVRLGLEVDWFPGCADAIRAALGDHPYDYLIGSVHFVDEFPIDSYAEDWQRLSVDERDDMHEGYWRRIISLAESDLFDIVGHVDLTKKFGFYPRRDLTALVGEALEAIADTRLIVELNTNGWHKPCDDAYPTVDILRGCKRRGVPVTLSSDAHDPAHLVRDFDRGTQRLLEAGHKAVARFAERQVRFDPLT